MNNKSFDSQRIAEGYAKRPWLHKDVIEQIKKDNNIIQLENGLDVGCGAGLSTKALRLLCNHVTGTDISPEMVEVCNKLYNGDSYSFYVAKAEETLMPDVPYDIITAAGVINWVDKDAFLHNAESILEPGGLIVIYDFWITDMMEDVPEYTKWYNDEYLQRFPKPFRKEYVWQQKDLGNTFQLLDQVLYQMTYDFSLSEFVDFMMIQSNVNEKIENGIMTAEEVRAWMTERLSNIFTGEKKTLIFSGYNWYIQKK